jgi:uncharacterized protein (TIGR02996 family)
MVFHPDADAFIARMIAAPDDTVIRLVFADWLEELGGVGNENWARYIRLRTEASFRHGIDRELLREDAANVTSLIVARLTLTAARLTPYFVEFLDLLPPDRFTVTLGDHLGPMAHVRAVGEGFSRGERTLVMAERDNLFAVASDSTDPTLTARLGQILRGGVVIFPTPTADLDAALDRHFPPLRVRNTELPTEVGPPTLDEVPTKQACQRLIGEAREEQADGIEVVALPSNYEVRFLFKGRTHRRHTISRASGEAIVERFYTLSDRFDSGVRALPRNTSFGDGVSVELRDGG